MLNKFVPYSVYKVLWGDRRQFGHVPDPSDPEWQIWQKNAYTDFYQNTQLKGIGNSICKMIYPVVSNLDFYNKHVLEIGPGVLRHIKYLNAVPNKYTLCDIDADVLRLGETILDVEGIPCETVLLPNQTQIRLPFDNNAFDTIVTFNSLEHLYPLEDYLCEMKRILRPNGHLVGGVPCEGGLAWGGGRYFTTRRYVHQKYSINYDKIISWEHPNFADFIIEKLCEVFSKNLLKLHPFSFLPIDFNLMISFVFSKKDS